MARFFVPGQQGIPLTTAVIDLNQKSFRVGLDAGDAPEDVVVALGWSATGSSARPDILHELHPAEAKASKKKDNNLFFEIDTTKIRGTVVDAPLFLRAYNSKTSASLLNGVPVRTVAPAGGLTNQQAMDLPFEHVPFATRKPMSKRFGGPGIAHAMGAIRGLAIHTTAGRVNDMGDLGNRWEKGDNDASTHFGIARDGTLFQYIALSYRGHGIDGNNIVDNFWYSVEVESGWVDKANEVFYPPADGKTDPVNPKKRPARINPAFARSGTVQDYIDGDHIEAYTPEQIEMAARLLGYLKARFGFQLRVADANQNEKTSGLSCHRWLDEARGKKPGKHCPGDANIALMPDIVKAAEKYAAAP